jgi:long-chain acyl-CoA synthetase
MEWFYALKFINFFRYLCGQLKNDSMRILLGRGEKTALVGKDLELSYDAILKKVSLFSSVLGDATRQRIAIFSDNKTEWIFAFYAIIKNKGIAVPIDALSTSHDVAYILKDCRPKSVFVSRDRSPVLQEAMKESGYYPTVIIMEEIIPDTESLPADEIAITEEETTALILYTSGTTGSPKGVMLSYKNIFTNLDAVCHDVPIYTKEERVMVLLPLHHVFSLVGTLIAPLYVNATLVLNTSLAAEEMIATLQQHKVSIMIGVPRLYQLLYKGLNEKIRQSAVAKLFLKITSLAQEIWR